MPPIYDQPSLLAYKVIQAHELAGHEHNTFDEKETAYATHLVKEHKRGIGGSFGHRPLHPRLASVPRRMIGLQRLNPRNHR